MTGPIFSLQLRLAFNRIDDQMCELLRQHKDFVLGELPAVLDAFYSHVSTFPGASAFFRSREHMSGAKSAQLRHWSTILDGHFDENYETSIRRIGETHYRIGLDPVWYIGGYNFLISGLMTVIGEKLGPTSTRGCSGAV